MQSKNLLGRCECGGLIAPVWYRSKEDKQPHLSHGSCYNCFKNSVVEQMSMSEYEKLNRR